MNALERNIIALTNSERTRRGLAACSMDEQLADVARMHSADMLKRNFFSHDNPDGLAPQDRVKKGYPTMIGGVGENIAYLEGYPDGELAKRFVSNWMNSPGHRANILKGDYKSMGLGIARLGNRVIATQVFADPFAILSSLPPKILPYGRVLLFEFSSLIPVSDLYVSVHFPDAEARYFINDRSFYRGSAKIKPQPLGGGNYRFSLKLEYGRGVYRVNITHGDMLYGEGIPVTVQ